ncbi:MAG: L,D-transpeptidase family protein [Hyphomicrobium sp.]
MYRCTRIATVLSAAAAAFACALSPGAHAQWDDMATIQFGITGPGAGNTRESYDREFIREWESNPPKGFATLSKSNIEPTKAAIKRYEEIIAQGGWAPIPIPEGKASEITLMQAGVTDPDVRLLRLRLAASGDLKDDDLSSESFDLTLEKALMRFQASNGLTPTGIADKRTLAALNVPAAARLKQLKANLPRLQSLSSSVGKRYVVVNIPAQQIEAIENGQIVARYAGVVGKPDRPTPLLTSSITDLNFNPVWRLPPTVVSEDLIPRGREMQAKGKNVLEKFGIDAYDGAGKKVNIEKIDWGKVSPGTYSYSQQPGPENPLGFLKINFGNAHSVYMHDTPSERIFGRNFRSASSGCIRVHNIDHLAAWLLTGQPGWNPHRIARMRETGERLDVRLKKPVALHFVYLSAWATDDGVVQFRRDIYQRDGVGDVAAAY